MIHAMKQILVPLLIVISGFLCIEFAVPIAVGEFLAGILGGQFINTEDVPWLPFFSHLGLFSVMFMAGFEIDIAILKRNLKANVGIGCCSFFVPFLCVLGVGRLLGFTWHQSAVFGVGLSTTSLAMIFSILKESGSLRTTDGQVLLGSAMVVDMLSMVVLAGLVFQVDWMSMVVLVGIALVVFKLKSFVVRIFDRYQDTRSEFELKFLLLMILSVALMGEGVGLHGAFLAFVLGVMFSDIDPQHEVIIEKLSTVVFSLLAPIFFFHAGTLIQWGQISWGGFGWIFVFGFVAIGSKFLSTLFGIRTFYEKGKSISQYAAIIFNYRLSFGIVTAMYAADHGIIDAEMTSVILIIVALASVSSVFLEKKLLKKLKTAAATVAVLLLTNAWSWNVQAVEAPALMAEKPTVCTTTREYVTAIEFIRKRSELGADEKFARKIADQVSQGCTGAARRFIRTADLLVRSTLTGHDSLKKAIELSHASDEVTETFVEVFRNAYRKGGLDLPVGMSLELATELSLKFNGSVAHVREDFERLVEYCVSESKLDLPKPACGRTAARVAALGEVFPQGASFAYIRLFEFMVSDRGPRLTTGDALKLSESLLWKGPEAENNFVDAYRYAVDPKGLGLSVPKAVEFAKKMAERSLKIEKPGISPGKSDR